MNLIVENILDMVETYGESETLDDLSVFSCPSNPEIESFLKRNAVDFAKKKLSVTYIVSDADDGAILGYFSLAHKALEIQKSAVSKTFAKKIERFALLDETNNTYTLSAFLLAQFGKNFAVDNGSRINGADLMDQVDIITKDIQHRIGGGHIYLDVLKRNTKVIDMYRTVSNYISFSKRTSPSDGEEYVQMIRAI